MVYRVITWLFIIANTILQVQVIHACQSEHGAVEMDCCCHHYTYDNNCKTHTNSNHKKQQDDCCSKVTAPLPQVVTDSAGPVKNSKNMTATGPPSTLTIKFNLITNLHIKAPSSSYDHAYVIYFGRPVYLATDRLRI